MGFLWFESSTYAIGIYLFDFLEYALSKTSISVNSLSFSKRVSYNYASLEPITASIIYYVNSAHSICPSPFISIS